MSDLAEEPFYRGAEAYTDPRRFERELNQLFLRYPICVGYTGELPDPGDYETTEIAAVPMIVMRGGDGEIRAFRNSCLHRTADGSIPPRTSPDSWPPASRSRHRSP